jgi:hypothetical protein
MLQLQEDSEDFIAQNHGAPTDFLSDVCAHLSVSESFQSLN